jgi:predicted enzyme related to lactoylglutathione lyase
MPVRTSYAEGTPSWIDLSTTDPAAAQTFYGELLGWDFEANPVPGGDEYIMASIGGKSAAGMMKQSPEQAEMGIPSNWNTYITVEDVAATVGKVEGAGGSVMVPPMQVMDSGDMAVVVDPTGAVVCLWQPNQHIGCEIVNEAGALIWNEMFNSDLASAKPFYEAVVGMGSMDMDMGEGNDPYTVFTVGEEQIAGAMPSPMPDIPNHWAIYFGSDDVETSVTKATELGGTVMAPVMNTPVGPIAGIADPMGATFFLMQPADAAASG